LLAVDLGDQPETGDVAVRDARRIGSADGLHRDPPRLVDLPAKNSA